MLVLGDNQLVARFPEVHASAQCFVDFQRTLRIPDDNQDYPLPAGLGRFPLFSVDEFNVPAHWKTHGGVFLPMYASEAMWINFTHRMGYPFAVKIAAGKVNAVTGQEWSNELHTDPQDYVVLPVQRWVDGFNVAKGIVRQFVAAALGAGITAEEQLTSQSRWAGVQLVFYPMKAEEYERRFRTNVLEDQYGAGVRFRARAASAEMGLAPGGRVRQQILKDPYGVDAWDVAHASRCFVHLASVEAFRTTTGRNPPHPPVTAKQYADARIPWFDYYDESSALPGSSVLNSLDSVATALNKQGTALDDNKPISIASTIDLSPAGRTIRCGEF